MNTSSRISPKRILWWGIGLLILGVLAQVISSSLSIQSAMVSDQIGNHVYYWVLSPVLFIIQNAAYPLGAAFIGASIVLRYLVPTHATLSPQQQHNEHL